MDRNKVLKEYEMIGLRFKVMIFEGLHNNPTIDRFENIESMKGIGREQQRHISDEKQEGAAIEAMMPT